MLRIMINAIRNHKARRMNDTIMRLMEKEQFMQIVLGNMETLIQQNMPTTDELIEGIDIGDIADRFDVDDIANYFDVDDLANEFDIDDIADCIDLSDVAGHVEIDISEVAEQFDSSDIAGYISTEDIANCFSAKEIAQQLDLDPIRDEVINTVLEDMQQEKEDLINQVIDEIIMRLGGEIE